MKKLADIINVAVDQKEILRAARAQALFKRWAEVVGDILSQKTTPDRFERGTLWVVAKSSTWAQELRMREDLVLSRMNDIAGEPGLFKEMRVGTGPRRRDLME